MNKRKHGPARRSKWGFPAILAIVVLYGYVLAQRKTAAQPQPVAGFTRG